ncbi:MAG: CPBP family intramembrane metalloprotease [Clostridiales bacterium]|nr:CPBP family intramembrane metalloprotease [Clostridiales bacterium]
MFFVVGIICCVWVGRQSIREFSGNIFSRESGIVLTINVVYALLVLEIGSLLGNYEINWAGVVYQSILCLICVGFTEEWIFRGFMVTQLNRVLKSKKAVVLVSSALFAMMHLPTYFRWVIGPVSLGAVSARLLVPFLMGIVYSLIFMWKKNLFTLIVIHGVYDLIAEIAFDQWYYIAYAIYWVMMIIYVIYCYRTRVESADAPGCCTYETGRI